MNLDPLKSIPAFLANVGERLNAALAFARAWNGMTAQEPLVLERSTAGVPNLRVSDAGIKNFLQRIGAVGSPITQPFYILDASSGGNAKVSLIAGYVNNTMPTLGGTALDTLPRPTTGTLTNGTWNIYLAATTDSGGIVTAVTVQGSTSAVPADGDTTANLLLGTVVVSGGVITAINSIRTGNHFHQRCGAASPYTHLWGT